MLAWHTADSHFHAALQQHVCSSATHIMPFSRDGPGSKPRFPKSFKYAQTSLLFLLSTGTEYPNNILCQ